MTGADSWIFRNSYCWFSVAWVKEWFAIPGRVIRHWVERAMRGYSQFDM